MTTATRTRKPRPAAAPDAEKFDPYTAVTDQIIALLEAGTAPWRKPWAATGGMPVSLSTGKAYRGINPFLLQMSAALNGYTSPFWGTYKAITDKGGQVRKGERSTVVVFWKTYPDKTEVDAKGNPKLRFVLRAFRVFNAEQADGLNLPAPEQTTAEHTPIQACEQIVAGYVNGPRITHGGDHACYSPQTDVLMMPVPESFTAPEEYYSTLFHELTHSTGHADRNARPDLVAFAHFGDAHYSREELVAELGSAMLAGIAGISPAVIDNSAAYLASWIKVLKGDSKLVIQAAGQAQKAADRVQGITWQDTAADAA